jgi:DNA-binding MarR family transcriptional regulator
MAKAKSKAKKTVAALERSPSHLLHRAVQAALDLYAAEFGPAGVTQRQYAVLAAAADHDGATQSELVRITGVDRSTLADMAARLITKGLLERQRSESDARANAVRLTEQGRMALEEARPRMAVVDARLLKLISGGRRREAFVGLLQDLVQEARPAEPKGTKPPKLEKPAKPAKSKKTKNAA